MSRAIGSLVKARGREWVVLPGSDDDLVMVRPLGGTDAEVTGIVTALETVEPASFDLPNPSDVGDARSARLLRDALRLGFRSSAGPFRSFGHLAVEPRPYQLVPLLMALRLDPVRLLIADDVGIGKTVEAGLIVRELLEQGDATRLAVLCPPHLAEQWQGELADRFHIDAELVLPSTAARLERGLGVGQTIFDRYAHTVVSIDFIKADRYRNDFLRTCPELVIVDEAHTCADSGEGRGGRHQRHELVAGLAADTNRHLILVTATPHSGKEGAFRSLLALVDPAFAKLPEELSGEQNRRIREQLARHLVQRRRADIRAYLDADTPFPERLEREETYRLSPEYAKLFDRVLEYARETVRDPVEGRNRQRVRWWSALALLRTLASSPAAAAATLRTRAANADAETAEEADDIGRRTVLDLGEDEELDVSDVAPGADTEDLGDDKSKARRRLRDLAREADALRGDADTKLVRGSAIVGQLVKDGYSPIVFCRFIDTADYVADELRARLPKGVEVASVTGKLPSAEREVRIDQLAEHPKRVLVATDCLSEGINLQDAFDAVVHYDLPWNPTRLEQREGRVDRFGQPRAEVRVVTYYGADNRIDETVLDVLLRKHRTIRSALGISIPVPGDTGTVIEALTETVLLRQDGGIEQRLPGFDEFLRPAAEQLSIEWDNAADREKRSRTVFAQETIKVDEVGRELDAVRNAIGSGADVGRFVRTALEAHHGRVSHDPFHLDVGETPQALRDALRLRVGSEEFDVGFELPVGDGVRYLGRTDPIVEGLARYVLDTALDPQLDSVARRCGVIRSDAVSSRTTLLLVRYRLNVVTIRKGEEHPLVAEDAGLVAFTGAPDAPGWLPPSEVPALLDAAPSGNVDRDTAADFITEVITAQPHWRTYLDDDARERADRLADAHARVREAARQTGVRFRVEPQLPPDVLGIFVLLPGGVR